MPREKRPQPDLIRMAENHLTYEMKMVESLSRIIKEDFVQSNHTLRNAVIESLNIHFRALLEFFFDENPRTKSSKTTNVLAADYYKEESEWIAIRKQAVTTQELEEAWRLCSRVNKEVVHLTWDRLKVDPQNRGWLNDWEKSYDVLGRAFQEFLRTVPDDVIGDEIREQRDRPRTQQSQ